jgi:tRNA A-37 threonylcarbamoyl transferase component Bud32
MAGPEPLLVAGRYALFDEIAAGGMATVHLGRLEGAAGFARVVAIKRLHPQHARVPELVTMLLDEARLAARIEHPNVVATLDVLEESNEVLLVFAYVHGESVSGLTRLARTRGERMPATIVSSVMVGALHGLHAAHEARGPDGAPLGVVHRDVSPQNVLVGTDGVARVIDFGIAKANVRSTATREGEMKGKLVYMAAEQIAGTDVTRASDVYAAGVLAWELFAGRRLFDQPTQAGIVAAILAGTRPRLIDEAPWVPAAVAAVVERALSREPGERWPTALAMADALEAALPPAPAPVVGAWVSEVAAEPLAKRAALVARVEAAKAVAPRVAPGAGAPAAAASARFSGLAVIAASAAVVAIALAALLLAGGQGDVPRVQATSGAAPVRDPSPGAEDDAQVDDGEEPAAPTIDAAPDVDADVSASASASPPVTAPPRPPAASPRPRPTSRPGTSVPLPACDPPWEVDAQGIRRVKRQCLGR